MNNIIREYMPEILRYMHANDMDEIASKLTMSTPVGHIYTVAFTLTVDSVELVEGT